MSPEKQRIAIAEACGWKPYDSLKIVPHPRGRGFMKCDAEHPNGYASNMPDYLNDPAAMREALMALPTDQKRAFAMELANLVGLPSIYEFPPTGYELFEFATATQHWPEAYLKTLGKWEVAP